MKIIKTFIKQINELEFFHLFLILTALFIIAVMSMLPAFDKYPFKTCDKVTHECVDQVTGRKI